MKNKPKIGSWYRPITGSYPFRGVLNSYSQVFFSDNPVFGLLVIAVTFLVPASGIAGLAGVVLSMLLARWLGFDKELIAKGVFSYNTLLVTLPLGLFFHAGWPLAVTILLASLLTFFLTVLFRGSMLKAGLPFLSWPFVISLWLVMIAIRKFTSIDVGEQSLFEWNRIYRMGGTPLVHVMEWVEAVLLPRGVKTYLVSLGAVFFQYNLLAGIVIAAGLLISSRIAFLLSLAGFFAAWLFYLFIGLDINTLDYSYIGFNYILTAIAVGGFFLIPSRLSFLWSVLLIPLVIMLTVSLEQVLSAFRMPVYALPFNVLVPIFLYVLYQRQNRPSGLVPVVVQHNSPERNLYAWSNFNSRLGKRAAILFRLPVLGRWSVSQGTDGIHTHRADWRFAWDFVKTGPHGKTWTGNGTSAGDYLCYGKPVYPPAGGVVESITDGIPDNLPGDANTRQNWGNLVVLKHAPGLYSLFAHLRPGSIRVKPGDYVTPAVEIGKVGNSGRSPQPHLHFHFQAEPNPGAATIDYPFGYFLLHNDASNELRMFTSPGENELVSNMTTDAMMATAFHMVPGQKLSVSAFAAGCVSDGTAVWEVHTDYYNNSYLYDPMAKATAWFVNDGSVFSFTHFLGPRTSLLFRFFSACFRVPLLYDSAMQIDDQLPLSLYSGKLVRWVQDWIAPFYLFIRVPFSLRYTETDDLLDPTFYRFRTSVSLKVFDREKDSAGYTVTVSRDGTIRIGWNESEYLEFNTQEGRA